MGSKTMRQYMKYMMALLLSVAMVACHTDVGESVSIDSDTKPALVLNVAGGELGVATRADDMADTETEYAITHLDIMIFEDGATDDAKQLFYHERATAAGPNGQVRLGVDISAIQIGAKYWVYVVANSTHSADTFANIGNVEALFDMEQEDYSLHLTGAGLQRAPSHFLMDGVAYMGTTEPAAADAIIIAERKITDTVELNVKLRRAAAKVVVKLVSAQKMTFAEDIADSTPGYYLINTPYATRVMDDGIVRQSERLETTAETLSEYYKWLRDAEGNIIGVEVTLYVYSHTWNTGNSFEYGTNLIVDIPAYYTTEVAGVESTKSHPNNYYQVPLTKEFKFERNHYYHVTANVNAPGAEEFTEPVEVDDLKYDVLPWTEHTIDVGGEIGPTYLKVNLDELNIYNTNIDTTSLLFSSSSAVTIEVQDCYYIDKFGTKQTISADAYNISGSTESGALSGNITVESDIPTNNTIRYFTLVITNETGDQEVVYVAQYPLVYVVNILGLYSYRDDFYTGSNDPTTIYNAGSAITQVSLGAWDDATGTWSYNYNASSPFWRSKVVRSTYPSTDSRDSYRGRSNIDYYAWEEDRWNDVNLSYSNAQDPGNARMYHVRITASSADYNLGVPRMTTDPYVDFEFTDPGADNADLVSPSFMIASRLGFVSSTNYRSANTDVKRISLARDHCAYYVEVADDGTIYDDWRLPTASELRIIIELQGTSSESADAIDYLLNADYYLAASGRVFNSKNDGDVTESEADSSSWAIRCIRDAY